MNRQVRVKPNLRICVLLCSACASPYAAPEEQRITRFASMPSDTFIVNDDALARLSMASPFSGSQSGCAHQGAHVQFKDRGAAYAIDIFAPADGKVMRVDTCFDTRPNDRYGLSLKIGTSNGEDVTFEFSIEPMGGLLCASDPHFYEKYIHVRTGDLVKKGTRIAELFHPEVTNGATHIHFHLSMPSNGGFFCPNIFNDPIAQKFHDSRNGSQCGGRDWATFCFMPDPGEDLVHGR